MSFSCIKYAIIQVADRETPAKQWTRTAPPFDRPLLMKALAAGKWRSRLLLELSRIWMTLYFISLGKKGCKPEVTWRTWVMPQAFSVFRSDADFILPKYNLSII